jgi:hypothetical protein
MVYFQTKNPNLGKFWTVLQWKILVYFMSIWSILWAFDVWYGHGYLVYTYFPVLVCCTKKNLATLLKSPSTQNPRFQTIIKHLIFF